MTCRYCGANHLTRPVLKLLVQTVAGWSVIYAHARCYIDWRKRSRR